MKTQIFTIWLHLAILAILAILASKYGAAPGNHPVACVFAGFSVAVLLVTLIRANRK